MSRSRDLSPLWYFINERHAIFLRKKFVAESGLSDDETDSLTEYDLSLVDGPNIDELERHIYTKDPILGMYRFCNVFRELDRVTVWIRRNIREPFADHPHLWLMLAAARTINWPETLSYLMTMYPHAWPGDRNFSPGIMGEALDVWKRNGKKTYTGAYMIRAESNPKAPWYSWTKQRYVAEIVLGRLWEDRAIFEDYLDDIEERSTLEQMWKLLQSDRYVGWGPFMSFQTVLEWRHTRYLRDAPDATTWAAVGPGSMRGLNRLHGRDVLHRLSQDQALGEMRELLELSRTGVLGPHVPPLEMEDVQNCLCETDKYLRVKISKGAERPRARYVPGRGW